MIVVGAENKSWNEKKFNLESKMKGEETVSCENSLFSKQWFSRTRFSAEWLDNLYVREGMNIMRRKQEVEKVMPVYTSLTHQDVRMSKVCPSGFYCFIYSVTAVCERGQKKMSVELNSVHNSNSHLYTNKLVIKQNTFFYQFSI